jgi:hypothetical protein
MSLYVHLTDDIIIVVINVHGIVALFNYVNSGPDVSIPINTSGFTKGKTATIPCIVVTSMMVTSVRWTYNDIDLVMDNSKYTGVTLECHDLIINNWQPSDSGRYRCFAEFRVVMSVTNSHKNDVRFVFTYSCL